MEKQGTVNRQQDSVSEIEPQMLFGFNIRILRYFIGGIFAIVSVICLWLGSAVILHVVDRHSYTLFPFRSLLVGAILPTMAFVNGTAGWKIWMHRPLANRWGIAASILQFVFPIWEMLVRSRPIWSCHLEVLAVGVIGMIVFLRPSERMSEMEDSEPGESDADESETENIDS